MRPFLFVLLIVALDNAECLRGPSFFHGALGWASSSRSSSPRPLAAGKNDGGGSFKFQLNGEPIEQGKGKLAPKLSPKKAKKAKLAKQRAGSAGETGIRSTGKPLADQPVRIEMARRGNKQVTMIRGLETPLDDRKALLKVLKSKVGVGGTVDKASGIIEIQGAHGAAVLALLQKQGFTEAKQSGKK